LLTAWKAIPMLPTRTTDSLSGIYRTWFLRHRRPRPNWENPSPNWLLGKVTGEKLAKLGIQTVADLRKLDRSALEEFLGRYGVRLHELARGIDENEVEPDRPTHSISVEDTFEQDVLLAETEPMIRRLAEKLWVASRQESRMARTAVLKLKTSEFKIFTRRHTPNSLLSSCEALVEIALRLRERVQTNPQQRYRLLGVGLSNFKEPKDAAVQPYLFD